MEERELKRSYSQAQRIKGKVKMCFWTTHDIQEGITDVMRSEKKTATDIINEALSIYISNYRKMEGEVSWK